MLALLTVFNSSAFLETRRLVQVFPEHVWKLWNYWELRVLVLVSLTLQLCLLHFGSRRRYSVKTWLRVFLWLSYLGADSVATVALGVISSNQGNCDDSQLQNELLAFWAPFLLLHLGGQDTITAYAVQDNELWLRHMLGLVVQSGVALYIILLFWKGSWLSFLTIPLFLAGFIKYAERTWILKSANNPMDMLVPMTGPHDMFDERDPSMYSWDEHPVVSRYEYNTGASRDAFILFSIFKDLFLNQKADIFISHFGYYSNFPNSQTAWKTIEDELGYAYDVYYTKAPLFFTGWGFLFRLLSFTSIVFVFVLFLIKERLKYPQIDLIITYLLLVGAVLIEIYAVILLCASSWPLCAPDSLFRNTWLMKHVTHIRSGCAKLASKRRWSNSMGQLNLLGLCLKDNSLQDGHGTPKLFAKLGGWAFYQMLLPRLNRELEVLFYRTNKPVSAELKDFVFNTFWEKLRSNSSGFSAEYSEYITGGVEINYINGGLEIYQSIIIWHLATDLCYYKDTEWIIPYLRRELCKDVSDYMMYILVKCPLAFSTGKAKLCFESTCGSVEDFLYLKALSRLPKDQVCEKILSEYNDKKRKYFSGDSVLPLAVELARELNQTQWKWEILIKFWVENLAYVATLCPGNYHAQLLRNGGEFLTHVWLLIEQFNLKESFQKSRTRQ